jgi:hypothetical protein
MVVGMEKGLTRAEILKKLPDLKKGNFELYVAKARVEHTGMRPSSKRRPHIMEYVYPADSVEKIQAVMEKRGV